RRGRPLLRRRLEARPRMRRIAQCAFVVGAAALLAFAWHCDETWFDLHVFWPQQFFIRADRRIAFFARAAAAAGVVLLFLLVRSAPRGDAARRLFLALLLAVPAAGGLLQWKM